MKLNSRALRRFGLRGPVIKTWGTSLALGKAVAGKKSLAPRRFIEISLAI
jgi:hypothetical protein